MSDSIPFISIINDFDKRRFELLPLQINAEVEYKLPNSLKIGASNHYTYFKGYSSNFLSGFIYTKWGQKMEAVATLSIYNFEKIMPGVGLSYTGESTQFYFASNNILELVQTTSSKNLNLSFGVNFLFSTH